MKIVCFAFIDEFKENKLPILCRERAEYIRSIKDLKRQKQSNSAWKLLQTLLENNDIDISNIYYVNGKWCHSDENVNFSISHKDNVLLVALSTEGKIGVDVEKICEKTTETTKKYLTKKGIKFNTNSSNDYFSKKWTELECKLKTQNFDGVFSYKKIIKDGNEYMLTAIFNEKIKIKQYK